MWKFIQLMSVASLTLAQAQDTTNNSTECPRIPGFFYRDGCRLLCQPATWTDVVIFYLGNYISHAATVTTRPGQSWLITAQTVLAAILVPGVGMLSGIYAISTFAKLAPTKLQTAARAGALYTVIRLAEVAQVASTDNDELPKPSGQDIESPPLGSGFDSQVSLENQDLQRHSSSNSTNSLYNEDAQETMFPHSVHGAFRLPPGYKLVRVPGNATFEGEDIRPWHLRLLFSWHGVVMPPQTSLCCGYNLIRISASIIQLLFATATLYNTRGDQIERYGYAAFGLTVVPYAWMSLVNLIGNLLCPSYDTIFLVGSEATSELETNLKRGVVPDQEQFHFALDGTVGFLTQAAYNNLCEQHSSRGRKPDDFAFGGEFRAELAATLISWVVPLAIIGSLSGFRPNRSALYERVWTMMWLTFGLNGIRAGVSSVSFRRVKDWTTYGVFIFMFAVMYVAVPIGGYVVVAQMILDFGKCVKVDR